MMTLFFLCSISASSSAIPRTVIAGDSDVRSVKFEVWLIDSEVLAIRFCKLLF